MKAGRDYQEISPLEKVRTVNIGEDMFERRIGMGRIADILVVLNGRDGTGSQGWDEATADHVVGSGRRSNVPGLGRIIVSDVLLSGNTPSQSHFQF